MTNRHTDWRWRKEIAMFLNKQNSLSPPPLSLSLPGIYQGVLESILQPQELACVEHFRN